MKSIAKIFIVLLVLAMAVTCLVACGHSHTYDKQITTENYLFSTATCTQKARYHYSCECGEKGTQTFEYGEALGHSWGEYVSDNNATYTADGTKTATCTRTDCGVTDTVIDAGTKLPSGISFSTFTVVDNTVNGGIMPYAQATFDFNQEIDVIGNATYDVCIDQYGLNDYASKTVPLVEGVNTFYVFEKVGGVLVNTYTVTIYRHHLYTVTFDTLGGSEVTSQQVEEGALLSTTVIPTKVGYTFASWDYNFDTPITSSMTITANWTANTDTEYKIEYYLQNVDDDNYTLSETVNKSGTTDTTASVSAKSIEHFTYNEALSIASGNIASDGSLVLKLYYTRDSYDITAQVNNSKAGTVSGSGTYKYAKEITLTATTKAGYTFLGWNDGTGIVCTTLQYKFTVQKDRSLTAEWTANTDTAYKVEYYLQNVNDNGYILKGDMTENKTGTTDTTASITAKSIEHFTYNSSRSTASGNIAGNGSLVLKLYYTRDKYTVTFVGDGGTLTSGNATQSIKYGGSAIAPTFTKKGYTLTGFDRGYDNITEPITVTAEWSINQYTLTIAYGNGQDDVKITQDYGTTIPSIANPTVDKAGYDFAGWDKDIPTTMPAKDVTVNAQWNAIFTVSNGAISGLTTYGENNYTELEIPSQIDGVEITSIGSYAFYYCDSLTSINIPDSVTSIGSSAFEDCTSLESVILSENSMLETIGVNTFYECTSLTSITIPDSVTSIGLWAFDKCTSLNKVNYLGTIDQWAKSDFYDDEEMIYGTSPLTYADLYINNVLVEDVVLTTATKIAYSAFYGCDSLKSITISDSVTSIDKLAFCCCDSLVSVTFGDNSQLESIGESAFWGCTSLTSITIPDSVKSIGSSAFSDCTSLNKVNYLGTIDQWVEIGFGDEYSNPLYYAKKLYIYDVLVEDVVLTDATKISDYAFYCCDSLTSITIPNSVISIGSRAFAWCYSLYSITIPDSVTRVDYEAFYCCFGLTIYCKAESKPSGWDSDWSCNSFQVVWGYKG